MDNKVEVRARFAGCNIKDKKTVLQFELDPEYKSALPQLAMMTGNNLNLDLTSDQTILFVDTDTGEVLDGQEQAFDEYEEQETVYSYDSDEHMDVPPVDDEVLDGQEDQSEECSEAFMLPPVSLPYECEDTDNEAA